MKNLPMQTQARITVPDACGLVMAESSIKDSGWGVFTLIPRKKGDRVHDGDPVIQIPDFNPLYAAGAKRLLWEYLWDGQETGGQYEGRHVMSMIPGIGMLANGEANLHNALPYKPQFDDGGLIRNVSPGAGASTHYHNFTWYSQKDLARGEEIFLNYGPGWFQERGYDDQPPPTETRTIPWLRENGYCVDNLVPGRSTIDHAGRGAFAVRDLEAGTIVAPVPVLPISSQSLEMRKEHESGRIVISEQLLRNYCFGHKNSSLLLFPYSPLVNLINHHSRPNLRLQWSMKSAQHFGKPIEALQDSSVQLLLELVAIRPIQKGEELTMDYGKDWVEAWRNHMASWQPATERYLPSQILDDIIRIPRTEAEQREHPYPDNAFTSCFYKYSNRHEEHAVRQQGVQKPMTIFQWKWTKGIYEMRNLRPCSVLSRDHNAEKGKTLYTVRILNRPGLDKGEQIPKGLPHIVTHVPRTAIQFSDKLYTTNQHLEHAFRKEIGLDDDIFPSTWMDLVRVVE